MIISAVLCLLTTTVKALIIYNESQVLAFGKLRHSYTSLAENFAVTFTISAIFLIVLLQERRGSRLK
jgi:subtilase family serine protease